MKHFYGGLAYFIYYFYILTLITLYFKTNSVFKDISGFINFYNNYPLNLLATSMDESDQN